MSTALIIIDDLGFEVMSREEASLLFRRITYCYDRGAILITTNNSVRDWTELLTGDEVLAAAFLDRLLHRSHVLNIKGRFYGSETSRESSRRKAPEETTCPERVNLGTGARVEVNSRSATTLQKNGKFRSLKRAENELGRKVGGGKGTGVQPSPSLKVM